MNVSPQTLFYS